MWHVFGDNTDAVGEHCALDLTELRGSENDHKFMKISLSAVYGDTLKSGCCNQSREVRLSEWSCRT